MPRGYRSIGFAALIAAILLSFSLGAYWVSLGQPQQPNRYPSYQSSDGIEQGALATAANIPIGVMERTPCHNPKSETESDLCAQWRAAKAAEKSADWTLYGVIASALGISLLLWQIMLTREAVEDTGRATMAMREANEIARKQQTSELVIGTVTCWIRSSFGLRVAARNIGNATAKSIAVSVRMHMSYKTADASSVMPFTMKDIDFGQAASENSIIHFGQDAVILDAGFFFDPSDHPLADLIAATTIKNGIHSLIAGEISWIGPFGEPSKVGFHIYCSGWAFDGGRTLNMTDYSVAYYEIQEE